MIKKYCKKPVVIEAMQIETNYPNEKDLYAFIGNDIFYDGKKSSSKDTGYKIKTLGGNHSVSVGDFIIKGIQGEFYPCKPDIFHLTYNKIIT